MQEHTAQYATQRYMQGPEEDGCAKALTEEAATARQLESAIASDEVRAYRVRLLQCNIGPVSCQSGPPCCLACDVQGSIMRENNAPLQAEATELAAAIAAEEEELLLLRAQVRP